MKYHYYTPLANQTKIEKKANRFLFSFALTPGELLGVRFPGCDGEVSPSQPLEAPPFI